MNNENRMKMENKNNLSFVRYTGYLLILLGLLSGLTGLLSSCEKPALPDTASGDWLPVTVHLSSISEGSSEELIRSSSTVPPVPETQTVSIGNGLLLDLSLEPEPALRAPSYTYMEQNKVFRVVALDGSMQYVSHADYTINASNAVERTSGDLHVPKTGSTVSYTFICVSLNSNVLPTMNPVSPSVGDIISFPDISAVESDLLYGSQTETVTTSTSSLSLSFTLSHKFSEAKIKIDCSYNGWYITNIASDGVSLRLPINPVTMDASGALSGASTSVSTTFSWPAITPELTTCTSLPKTMYMPTSIVAVAKNALTVNGSVYPSEDILVLFSPTQGASIVSGGRYTLRLRVRQLMFAASNIYWDTTDASNPKLTFEPYSATPNNGPSNPNNYQGVYFKQGSLVGISPKDAWGDASTVLYVPKTNKAGWYTTFASTVSGGNSHAAQWTGTTYAAIPREDTSPPTGGPNNNWLAADAQNQSDDWNACKGDICRYISENGYGPSGNRTYRLPSIRELGYLASGGSTWNGANNSGWTRVDDVSSHWNANNYLNTAEGTFVGINTGANYSTNNFFPASGFRSSEGVLSDTYHAGVYKSGSVLSSTSGYPMKFLFDAIRFSISEARENGSSVRCVID
jgi:hypothetical protein